MAKNKPTIHMAVLLDESGSMAEPYGPGATTVVEETNTFIETLKEAKAEGPVQASLAMFDAVEPKVRVKYEAPLEEVRAITLADYAPRGATPLNDAVAATIGRVSKAMKEGDRAMVVIFTDGKENASELATEHLRDLIQQKERENFAFIYLGAHAKAFDEAADIGLAAPGKSFQTTNTVAGTRSSMRRAGTMGVGYMSDHQSYPAMAASMPRVVPEDEDAEEKPKPEEKSEASTDAANYLRGTE